MTDMGGRRRGIVNKEDPQVHKESRKEERI
jgi:hypothetical protein